jgi:hypothetical protein
LDGIELMAPELERMSTGPEALSPIVEPATELAPVVEAPSEEALPVSDLLEMTDASAPEPSIVQEASLVDLVEEVVEGEGATEEPMAVEEAVVAVEPKTEDQDQREGRSGGSMPMEEVKVEIAEGDTFDAVPADIDVAPPPPPPRASASVEHVDVDLGPLKSVSRNHAKIEYHLDLGHFCLEIYGRNGAWVDDRYYVKGSTVPLNQG